MLAGGLLLEQHLLDGAHLPPDVAGQDDGDDEGDTEDDGLLGAAVVLGDEEDTQVDEDELLRQGQEGGGGEVPELDVAGGEDGGGEVGGDDGESDNKDDLFAREKKEMVSIGKNDASVGWSDGGDIPKILRLWLSERGLHS